MINGAILKVKSGQVGQWRAWCEELKTSLISEALETLKDEQVFQEASFLFEINGEFYVLGFMDGECLPADMTKEINIKHKKKKEECLEYVSKIETLYNLKQ